MAVYRNRSREVAERLIKLRDYLYVNATPTHAVKARDMLAYLESVGHKIEIKTLYSDLETLRNFLEVKVQYDKHLKGYILKNPKFEAYDLQLIVNSIQAFSFITQKEADRLTAKIRDELANKSTHPSLTRQTLIPNRVRSINQDAMKGLDTIYEAIAQNRKISYRYLHYYPRMSNSQGYELIHGNEIITVSPYKIILLEKKYHIISACKKNGADYICAPELEHMTQIKILPERREGESIVRNEFKNEFEGKKHISYTFGRTKLKVPYFAVESVLEKFGIDTVMIPDNGFMIASINESPSPSLYIWTRTFRPIIEIVFPEDAEIKLRSYFLELSEGKLPLPPYIAY